MLEQNILSKALYVVAVFNVVLSCIGLIPSFSKYSSSFTFVGHDYPILLPIDPLPNAEMTIHESVHYSLNGPQAPQNWATLDVFAPGFGYVRLGSNDRWLEIAIFHEFHCLRELRAGIGKSASHPPTDEHMRHCLAYLRQHILCMADDALEKGDFMELTFGTDRIQDTVICEDWSLMFDLVESNYRGWKNLNGY